MGACPVTVLMSAYNAQEHIREAVDSIFAQTFADFELIVINDGSTDHTANILNGIRDSRLRIVENPSNIGLVASLNKGLQLAAGRYIVRMDADDVAMSSRLEKLYLFMEANPEVGVCGSAIRYFGASDFVLSPPLLADQIKVALLWENVLAHPSVVMRRECLQQYDLHYSNDFPHCEDYRLWTECVRHFPLRNLPDVLLHYRIHPSQTGTVKKNEMDEGAKQIRLQYLQSTLGDFEQGALALDLLGNAPVVAHEQVLEATAAWIRAIYAANREKRFFSEDVFHRQLALRWARLCRRSRLPRRIVWRIFSSAGIGKHQTLWEKARILLPR